MSMTFLFVQADLLQQLSEPKDVCPCEGHTCGCGYGASLLWGHPTVPGYLLLPPIYCTFIIRYYVFEHNFYRVYSVLTDRERTTAFGTWFIELNFLHAFSLWANSFFFFFFVYFNFVNVQTDTCILQDSHLLFLVSTETSASVIELLPKLCVGCMYLLRFKSSQLKF